MERRNLSVRQKTHAAQQKIYNLMFHSVCFEIVNILSPSFGYVLPDVLFLLF